MSTLYFPHKKYRLLTVVNGMCQIIQNPKEQYQQLLKTAGVDIDSVDVSHTYIDKTKDMEEHVLKTAIQDKHQLGCPGICSACKLCMEKSLSETAKHFNSDTVVLGYTKYQGLQEWVEQTPEQMHFLENEIAKTGVKAGSPLYDVIEYPMDAVLLLSAMGIPVEKHKHEMKCVAAGLNPSNLNKEKLMKFLDNKLHEVKNIHVDFGKDLITEVTPEDEMRLQRLVPMMKELKADADFVKGSFREN